MFIAAADKSMFKNYLNIDISTQAMNMFRRTSDQSSFLIILNKHGSELYPFDILRVNTNSRRELDQQNFDIRWKLCSSNFLHESVFLGSMILRHDVCES